jgi:hypothetical protein
MSVLKADIRQREWHVRYVPHADMDEGRGLLFLSEVSLVVFRRH